MADRYHKRHSTSLIIREIRIEATRRYHLTPVRMAIIREARNNVLARMWRKGNPYSLLVKCKSVQPLWKTVQRFLKKLKIVLTALADVAQWIEHQPVNQRVAGLIPSQGICLGCRPGPQ